MVSFDTALGLTHRVLRFGNGVSPASVSSCCNGEVWAHGGVFLLLTILACVSPVFVDRHAGFGRVCTYSRCGIRIRPNQIELIGVDLVVILVILGPQSSLSVVGKPSAKRPEAVMVSVFPIFDGMVLLRRSCNRSGMTRLVVWSVSLFIESVGPCLQGVWRLGLNFIILVFSVSKHAKIILEVGKVYAVVPSGA